MTGRSLPRRGALRPWAPGGPPWLSRRGVQFHNGQPFNAEAVKVGLDRLVRSGGGSLRLGAESVKVVDETTVDITPTQPNLRLVDQLVHPSVAPMVAPNTEVGTQPTGTGPFRFVEYVKGERLVVERSDTNWGENAKLVGSPSGSFLTTTPGGSRCGPARST